MSAFDSFLKQTKNYYSGPVGLGFLGLDVAAIAASDNKLKELAKTLARIVLYRPLLAIGLAGAFSAMGKSIRSLVHDTGSLEQFLKKLASIQGLQRTFAPLVGGANAAKLKVASLVNFASQNNLKLDDVGEAAHTLAIMTHGAYAGTKALETISDTAAATNNNLNETASVVGEFYSALRNGDPINIAAERMRQMGILGDDTVKSLIALQQSGAGNAAVFDALTAILEKNKGAMKGMQGEIAAVNAAFAAAQDNIKEQFASPFAASDIQNTKNMTEAMNAIAPSIGRVSEFLSNLTGAFSTFKSWLAKTIAESPALTSALELLVEAMAALIAIASTVAMIALGVWAIGAASAVGGLAAGLIALTGAAGTAAVAIEALGAAVSTALIASGIGAIVVALGVLAAAAYNFYKASERQKEALDNLAKAHAETDAAMEKQIKNAETLKERHEALAKAIQESADAQKEYQDALAAKQADDQRFFGIKNMLFGPNKNLQARVDEAEKNAQHKQAVAKSVQAQTANDPNYISPERAAAEREVARAHATIQGNPEEGVGLDNLDKFAANFERMRKVFGDKEGSQKAQDLTQADIIQSAPGPVADHLAKIGLGGEAGVTDTSKQLLDVQRRAAEYLGRIDANTSGRRDIKALNVPQSGDDNPI